jgi:hypothetical protein
MKSLRLTAGILSPVAKLIAVLFSLVSLYALVVIVLSLIAPGANMVPIHVGEGRFEIYYPFTRSPFLLGDYTAGYLVPMLLTVCFYSLFFWLLSGVFDAFRQEKLFVYISNLTLPLLILLVAVIYRMGEADMLMIAVLHAVLGIFAYFMAAIFKEGVLLQEEQDLTL